MDISKVSITKLGGLEVEYATLEKAQDGQEQNPMECKIKNMATPHPDLLKLFADLVVVVADVFKLIDFGAINMGDDEDASMYLKLHEESLERIKVKSVQWTTGNGVILAFDWMAENGGIAKCATPKIGLDDNCFGFEEYLASVVDKLREETELYMYGSKRAQLSLFSPEDGV